MAILSRHHDRICHKFLFFGFSYGNPPDGAVLCRLDRDWNNRGNRRWHVVLRGTERLETDFIYRNHHRCSDWIEMDILKRGMNIWTVVLRQTERKPTERVVCIAGKTEDMCR